MASPSLFMRFFGLAENLPLYAMVGIACGLAAYTPIRHLVTAPDIALDRDARDPDCMAANPRTLERAKHYEGGILGGVASIKDWPQVWPLPKTVPQEHFHFGRWPAPRPFALPATE